MERKLVIETRDDFNQFWAVYPRREARLDALKAWIKLDPSPELLQQMLEALDWQVRQPDWLKADGQFVPLPATWIRGERWLDERRGKDRRVGDRRAAPEDDWFEECKRLHGGKCGLSQTRHWIQRQIDAGKEPA